MSRSYQVSVVIPVFNGEKFLAEAIESVLAQKQPDIEILIVDDGSTDGTAAVAEKFGDAVRLIRQPNRGVSAARNHGIRLAQAEVLAFLDADDLFTPDKFALQLPRLRNNPGIDVVIGQLKPFATGEKKKTISASVGQAADELQSLSFGCSLFRGRVFDRIGPLSETMRFCEDWDWFMRAREARVGMLIHRQIVLRNRLHEENATRQREAGEKFLLEMFRRSLARRRAGNGGSQTLPPLSTYFETAEVLP
ncbi:MAG: glycosyltransferase family A protein [Akkermansiaceae bacterium]